jgi:hypothetical protein
MPDRRLLSQSTTGVDNAPSAQYDPLPQICLTSIAWILMSDGIAMLGLAEHYVLLDQRMRRDSRPSVYDRTVPDPHVIADRDLSLLTQDVGRIENSVWAYLAAGTNAQKPRADELLQVVGQTVDQRVRG